MQICLFDIDGTLISSGGAGVAALYNALKSEFGKASADDGVAIHGRTDCAITRDLFEVYGIENSPLNWDRFRAAYLHHLGELLPQREGGVLPGVLPLLQALKHARRVALGLLTGNTRAGARLKLDHFGLTDYFAFGGFGDVHFARDDVARDALHDARRQGVLFGESDRVWVIGDTPLDVACARAVGARAVAVATGQFSCAELTRAEPDHLVADFSNYEEALAWWS